MVKLNAFVRRCGDIRSRMRDAGNLKRQVDRVRAPQEGDCFGILELGVTCGFLASRCGVTTSVPEAIFNSDG